MATALTRRPDKQTFSSEELRDQVRQEMESKSKLCANPTYECSLQRIDGYDYCIRHVLQRDQSGNFRPCSYIYLNGRKCPNALPKYDLKKDPTLTTYCFEHSRQAQLIKTRAAVGKLRFAETNEVLLNHLSHHLNTDDLPESVNAQCMQEEEIDVVSPHIASFMPHQQTNDISKIVALSKKKKRILDYASDSSSECYEPMCLKNTARGHEYDESDAESIDSIDEDPLKHAEIYSREEVIRISEQKLIRLRKLYLGQVQRLSHLLRDRRRQYLLSLRKEREVLCSIHDQVKESQAERMLYKQLKAYSSYHHRHGVEAVLYKKFKEKRARECNTVGPKAPVFVKCAFTEGGVKCIGRVIPCCKFCRKHILEDKKQTLFRACNVEKSGIVCQDPIPGIFDDSTCVLHLPFPPRRFYTQKKYESETDEDDGSRRTVKEIKLEASEEPEPAKVQRTQPAVIDDVKKEENV